MSSSYDCVGGPEPHRHKLEPQGNRSHNLIYLFLTAAVAPCQQACLGYLPYNVFINFTLNTKSVVLKIFYGMTPISGT